MKYGKYMGLEIDYFERNQNRILVFQVRYLREINNGGETNATKDNRQTNEHAQNRSFQMFTVGI